MQVQVRVLGGLEVLVDGAPVDLGSRTQRTLFALLVVAERRVVPVDRLVDLLWGDEPPAKALVSLQSYVARGRRVLEPARGPRSPGGVLLTRVPGYA